jgi:cellulose synthase (UDP-forming)
LLIFFGLQSVLLFGLWWFRPEHVNNGTLFVFLSIAVWYGISRVLVGWFNYFHVEQPPHLEAFSGLSVAIFTTSSPGEPLEMFERTLAAAREVRYPHTTYLLDDTRDARFRECAERHGAIHLELLDLPGAKAGKINAALQRTSEEFILVLDPDHVPLPEFLDRVLGHFASPGVGFVQVAQTYYNAARSFVARAAAEQTFAFYGPIMQGMYGSGTTVAIGANCTFRRAALQSIGGHGIGLAEDLVTAIRLHAAGWKSVYVPEVVARGLVPEDLGSFMKQQLKWSRGVYEVLLREYPRAFLRLEMHQKLAYLMIGTYYFVGLTSLIYFLVPLLFLWFGVQPASMFAGEFLYAGAPVALFAIAIYLFVQRWLIDPERERGLHWRGMLLKVGCWSVYLHGFLLAVANVAVPYVPTAKVRRRSNFWKLAAVPLVTYMLLLATLVFTIGSRLYVMPESEVRISTEATFGMVAFLLVNGILMSGRLYAAWSDRERR